MAIVERRIVAAERDGEMNAEGQRTYSERWFVRTDSGVTGPRSILFSGLVPQVGQPYPAGVDMDRDAKVSRVRVSPAEGPHAWWVDVEWSTASDPVTREPVVQIRFEQIEVPLTGKIHTDISRSLSDLRAVLNSAQEPFVPPPTKLDARMVIVINRVEEKLNMRQIRRFQNTVNARTWADFPPETLRLTIGHSNEQFYNQTRVWDKTYELAYNPLTWKVSVLDWGTRTMAGVDPSYGYNRLEDNLGNPVEAGLLNGAGASATTPVFLDFYPYERTDFGELKLPEDVILDRAD